MIRSVREKKQDGEYGKGVDILGRLARGGLVQKGTLHKMSKGHKGLRAEHSRMKGP